MSVSAFMFAEMHHYENVYLTESYFKFRIIGCYLSFTFISNKDYDKAKLNVFVIRVG